MPTIPAANTQAPVVMIAEFASRLNVLRASNNNGCKANAMRRFYWFFGHRLTILAGPVGTEGRYDLVEGWDPPGTQVPLHRHRRYSERI
jgi:hypothetical protein